MKPWPEPDIPIARGAGLPFLVEHWYLGTRTTRHMMVRRFQEVLEHAEKLELNSWQPEVARRKDVKFSWKPETWYRMKLEVTRLGGDKVRARGKAWAVADPEPAEWMVETVDPVGNLVGSPGIYADAPFEVFFDNIVVTPNK